MPDRLQRH